MAKEKKGWFGSLSSGDDTAENAGTVQADETQAATVQPSAQSDEKKDEPVAQSVTQPAQAGGDVITNPSGYVRRIGTVVIAPGGSYTLTAKDRADEKTMGKIEYMIKLKVLHRGAA